MSYSRKIPTKKQKVMNDIIGKVSDVYEVNVVDIMGRERHEYIMDARNAAYRILREVGFSTIQIGAFMGRDHSTVVSGSRACDMVCDTNALADAYFQRLRVACAAITSCGEGCGVPIHDIFITVNVGGSYNA